MLPLFTQRWPAWGLDLFLKLITVYLYILDKSLKLGNIIAVTVDFKLLSSSEDDFWFSGAVTSKSEVSLFFSPPPGVKCQFMVTFWKNEAMQAVTFLMIPSQLEVNIISDASYSIPLPPWGMTNLQDANVTLNGYFYQDTNKVNTFFSPSWLFSFTNSSNI